MFQPIIVVYRRSNFVYYYWGRTSIYQPLDYPFRSLIFIDLFIAIRLSLILNKGNTKYERDGGILEK